MAIQLAAELVELGETLSIDIFQRIPAPSVDLTPVKIFISVTKPAWKALTLPQGQWYDAFGFLVAAVQAYCADSARQ